MGKRILQIQPQYLQGDAWLALAEREGLLFEAVEFFAPPLIVNTAQSAAASGWYLESGRVHSLHGAFIDVNPASSDPKFRLLSQQRSHESCLLADAFGARNVVLHCAAFPFLRGAYLDNWVNVCASYYTKLANESGLNIFIENSFDLDPAPLYELFQRIESENVRICLDIGHANFSGTPLEEWFERLGKHIAYLHLSDNLGRFDDHLPLGEGTVDWEKADRLWRALGRDMPMTLEVV